MPDTLKSVLILGGTGEAVDLADRIAKDGSTRVVTSLAGRTVEPKLPAGDHRIGGFGGVDGLAAYLRDEGFDLLIDATHPFAETISANAHAAAEKAGVRLVSLQRPLWQAQLGDQWTCVETLEAACSTIPARSRVLLALGSQHIGVFSTRDDVHFILRMVDPPLDLPSFTSFDLIGGKPSTDPEEEARMLRDSSVSHIVCRNSGGTGAYAKILAARALGLPVIMVERPRGNDNGAFETVDALMAAIS
ncbi:cobalt-precorrin-6A reductase [Hoeflea prorocentri]|uniref:Cobalt-precorrin-6A reductase n=1 Tax=Hoeflea prorocentri TaxID=1922333 RepID=A0A9X3UHD6_9HYPH|nr:cobalt-precorrin-6A reductase [Hoeflea prorocentri]MCY6381377.1 cobalt-precorrin-6A reductase [Hoeflea prorocentri]MDA5399177.1 cobalt-precorrin-6A reductase [Hoeflea prorocentri]